VQLRSKHLSDRQLYDIGKKMRSIASQYQKLFFVNDRVDLAVAVGADGVHVGQSDMPVSMIREIAQKCGQLFFIGKSTHNLEQAHAAVREGVDYIGVGPVFKTPTKEHYEPVGLDLVRRVGQSVLLPFVAIGGIDASNIEQVLQAGATRIAVVRAIFSSEDSEDASRKLRKQIEIYQ
jgi:thiamine-phosphate pyrophosphorylase